MGRCVRLAGFWLTANRVNILGYSILCNFSHHSNILPLMAFSVWNQRISFPDQQWKPLTVGEKQPGRSIALFCRILIETDRHCNLKRWAPLSGNCIHCHCCWVTPLAVCKKSFLCFSWQTPKWYRWLSFGTSCLLSWKRSNKSYMCFMLTYSATQCIAPSQMMRIKITTDNLIVIQTLLHCGLLLVM